MDAFDFNVTFLEYVREVTPLWQPSDALFINRKLKNAAWEEIAVRLKLLYPNCEVTPGKKLKLSRAYFFFFFAHVGV